MTAGVATKPRLSDDAATLLTELRDLALAWLPRMFDAESDLFVFRVRKTPRGIEPEGRSRRYTAITLIGLAEEGEPTARAALAGRDPQRVVERLLRDVQTVESLGDVALTLWAAAAWHAPQAKRALESLSAMDPELGDYATVELAWALAALCVFDYPSVVHAREKIAKRLIEARRGASPAFPHQVGRGGRIGGHVACFADQVYPIQALSFYYGISGDPAAGAAARRCADCIVKALGPAGQWWWHYDARDGAVLEGYPVYSVHQDAMAPMALFALMDVDSECDYLAAIERGLRWMNAAPELGNQPIIDRAGGILWRKVARREPNKLTRRLQAAVSALGSGLRAPGVDTLFPPGAIDYELRPYHLGWLLYAFSPKRLAALGIGGSA